MADAPRPSGEIASHGRGGRGNIGPDDTKYVDGEIVRTGVEGSHDDGPYSGGRGGAGNIGSPGLTPTQRKDAEAIPDAALRPSMEDRTQHFGRGGGGNIHIPEEKKKTEGLADKLKNKLFKKKVESKEANAETTTS